MNYTLKLVRPHDIKNPQKSTFWMIKWDRSCDHHHLVFIMVAKTP